ncbi:MAG: Amuc_1099 family pilus-like system protein [Verrucomicrobiota bacterium]
MEWLKKNYERAILAFAALLLLVSGGLIINNVSGFSEQFTGRNSSKRADNTIKPYPTEKLIAASGLVKTVPAWGVHDGSLFVSRPYVLKEDGNGGNTLIDPTESPVDLHPPIKNSWLLKYGLPYWEKGVKDQDSDADRFSNVEEFIAGTDPRERNSVPPYYTKLQLLKFISKPFRLIFTSSPDDGKTFAINTKDLKGRTQFLEKGQMIDGTPYKVIAYEAKKAVVNEIEKDVSVLTIENTEDGRKILLVANKESNDPTSFAEFRYLYDNSKFTVKKEDEFSLAPETGRKYKLIDISEAEALIQDLNTKEQYKVAPVK